MLVFLPRHTKATFTNFLNHPLVFFFVVKNVDTIPNGNTSLVHSALAQAESQLDSARAFFRLRGRNTLRLDYPSSLRCQVR